MEVQEESDYGQQRANKRLCRQGVPLAIFYFCDEGVVS